MPGILVIVSRNTFLGRLGGEKNTRIAEREVSLSPAFYSANYALTQGTYDLVIIDPKIGKRAGQQSKILVDAARQKGSKVAYYFNGCLPDNDGVDVIINPKDDEAEQVRMIKKELACSVLLLRP
jgi:vacuolar-type H+-ATPase subunit F/Vma7